MSYIYAYLAGVFVALLMIIYFNRQPLSLKTEWETAIFSWLYVGMKGLDVLQDWWED